MLCSMELECGSVTKVLPVWDLSMFLQSRVYVQKPETLKKSFQMNRRNQYYMVHLIGWKSRLPHPVYFQVKNGGCQTVPFKILNESRKSKNCYNFLFRIKLLQLWMAQVF